MKLHEVERFKDSHDLAEAIDNGGRFYHLFSQAHDNVVSKGELAKAAGVWASDQNTFLFLELALDSLSQGDREEITAMLEPELRHRFQQKRPATLKPSQIEADGEAGEAVVVEGYPELIKSEAQFGGFIYVPIVVGGVTTFSMIPIFDEYDVHQVFDTKDQAAPSAMIAAEKGKDFRHEEKIRFGGFLRELAFEDESARTHKLYLEAGYYTRLGGD